MPSLAELHNQTKRLLPYRWPLLPLLLACFALALAALLIPLSEPTDGTDRATRSMLAANTPGAAPAEDLTGFLAINRWGAPVEKEEAEPEDADSDPDGLNPALQGIGFIGVTFMEDEYAVLLNLSAAPQQRRQNTESDMETGMVRLLAGDTLPDGRTLVAVTPDSLTLGNAEGDQERFLLFGQWDETPE